MCVIMKISSTLKVAPVRCVVYGAGGIGKSTMCAGAPGAVFIRTEQGLNNIDALAVDDPKTWEDIIKSVDFLANEPSCKTLVIDSIDWAEPMCWDSLCRTKPTEKGVFVSDIEDYGFGKGYKHAVGMWRHLISRLDKACDNGKNVVLIAHSQRKVVRNLSGEDYESCVIKLQELGCNIIREWADVVGFAELDIDTISDGGKRKTAKAVSSGRRVLRVGTSPAHCGKSKYSISDTIDLSWESLASAIEASRTMSISDMSAELESLLSELGSDDVASSAYKYLGASPLAHMYSKAIKSVRLKIEEKKNEKH